MKEGHRELEREIKEFEEELEREKLRDLERMKRAAKTRDEFKKANEELLKIQQEIAVKEQEEEKKKLNKEIHLLGAFNPYSLL